MSRPPTFETLKAQWRGVHFEIKWKENWLVSGVAHLEIICTSKGDILPVTETGYRSHFIAPEDVIDRGGPVAYVIAWLDAAATSPEWQKRDSASRQLTLF